MAVGDYVNDVYPINTTVNFQPAAGVVICLTHVSCYSQWVRLTDGTNTARVCLLEANASSTNQSNTQMRLFINNDHYIRINADSSEGSQYTGIQVA